MNNNAPKGFVRKMEAANRLAVKMRTLDNWMRRGLVPFVKVGRSVYFKECDLLRSFGCEADTANASTKNTNCKHNDKVLLPDATTKYMWCRDCGSIEIPVAGWVTPKNMTNK